MHEFLSSGIPGAEMPTTTSPSWIFSWARETAAILSAPLAARGEDPLLQLFYGETLSADDFHDALRQQRGVPLGIAQSAGAGAQA